MGIFEKPKYEESETGKAVKRQLEEEERLRKETEKKQK